MPATSRRICHVPADARLIALFTVPPLCAAACVVMLAMTWGMR